MKITKITAGAARQFNHPWERFANFRCEIRLEAELTDGDDTEKVANDVIELSIHAECVVERRKQHILSDLNAIRETKEVNDNIKRLSKWPKQVEKDRAEVAKMEEYYGKPFDRLSNLDKAFVYDRWNVMSVDASTWDNNRPYLENQANKLRESADRMEKEYPEQLAELQARLAAIPPLRLLPGELDALKEIHPGHPDHPETDNEGED